MHLHDPASLVSALGGVVRGTRLQQFGLTRHDLAAAVDAGDILRVRPGVFASKDTHPDELTAVRHGGSLTCASALRRHGVWVLPEAPQPHVWVGRRGRTHPHPACACVNHFFRGTPPLSLTSVPEALMHLYACAGAEAFFTSFESAWRLGLLTRADRSDIRRALPATARWLVDLARADADSGLESLLRLRLHLLGILLECQVTIAGVGRVDFLAGRLLIIEVDGRANHDGSVLRHEDLARDAAASASGYETLRFDYAQIVHDWTTVQSAVLGALARLDARA